MMNKIFLDSNILIYLYTADELDKIVTIASRIKQDTFLPHLEQLLHKNYF